MSNSSFALSAEERILIHKGLELLAASFERKAKSSLNPDVAAIYGRNVAQVNILITKVFNSELS